jgi:hypothetical protein
VIRSTRNGVGVVFVNGFGVWCLWVAESGAAGDVVKVRMSLDDFDALGVHEYQRVRLKLPRRDEASLYLRSRRENPPFVWLEFARDVRR